jgi:tetraacyldisaccharide 4'-kinase
MAETTLVETRGARHVHLLDDGMQHRKLARDVEIVLLHRSDFETTLLPAGRLREPLSALERADFVVLREEDRDLAALARRWMRVDAEVDGQMWTIRRELKVPALPGAAVAFCAIAHPEEFFEQLRTQGIAIAGAHAWRDHHRFANRDLTTLCDAAAKLGAKCFVTTEKDLVRLTKAQRARLEETAPLFAGALTVRLFDSEMALVALEQRLHIRGA